ncbi:MAG: Xaa-Pro peptidase family protein [Trueperaceae bacterium]|nr:Xaa-Pro peptidase family protein [Trueperaceae bacterium]
MTSTSSSLATPIPAAEYQQRRSRLLAHLDDLNAACYVWWGNAYIFYLCGFAFVPTERPIALVISDDDTVLFVPRLEVEHAQAYAHVDRVVSYPEYPDATHPMTHLADLLTDLGYGGEAFAGDGDGYGRVMGYRGPKLSDETGGSHRSAIDLIEAMMQVKSDHEIALIRESARWASVAHRMLQDLTRVGLSETEVMMQVSQGAYRELIGTYGDAYRALSWGSGGPMATYRGQIGKHSAFPHALDVGLRFQEGDTLVTGATCPMFGYYSELERTMFVGAPSDAQRTYFGHMLTLQDLAIDACRVGETGSSVDHKVRDYFAEYNLEDYWRHHTGHNIGVRYHEGPFLDVGDDTVIEAGMLFTVEPGIYVEGLGGFRHSDTIVVTEAGPEFLTEYPRDLESLILPV